MPNDNKAKWTIMIYMAADDAIGITEAFRFLGELQELSLLFPAKNTEELEDSRDIRVLLQAYTDWNEKKKDDGTVIQEGGFGPRRFEVDSNFQLDNWLDEKIEEKGKGDFRMGSSEALFSFIKWCKEKAPAEKYMLFLWGHGTGSSMFSRNLEASYAEMKMEMRSLSMTDMETGLPITDIKELTRIDSPYFKNNKARLSLNLQNKYFEYQSDKIVITRRERPDFYKEDREHFHYPRFLFDVDRSRNGQSTPGLATNSIRKYLSTRSSLDALLEKEIREALTEVKKLKEPGKERPIDILLIMGCAMQMVEFAYEISPYCKYFIGSEELIYFHGYNYFDSFTALHDYPEMDAPTLAKRIVQEAPIKSTYTDFEKHSLAIACVDLEKNGKLTELIEKFAKNVMEKMDDKALWLKIKKARRQCRHFGEDAYTYSFIDVAWFFKKFAVQVTGNDKYDVLQKTAEEIIKLIEGEYIVQSWIGKKRTPTVSPSQFRSFGGHGVGIYFPESVKAHADNADLKVFFDKGHPLENKFTKDSEYWYKMVLKYRTAYGEVSSYPLTDNPASEDPEVKKLKEELQRANEGRADQLMETEKLLTGTLADQLLEEFEKSNAHCETASKRYKEAASKGYKMVVDLLLDLETMKRGPLADTLLVDYANANTPVKSEA